MNGRTNSHGSTIDDLQVPLDPCTNFRAEAGNGSVTLSWDDPVDKYATPAGSVAADPQQLVSVWDHTIVVRKVGSQPANPNDGIVVTSSGVRDQYLSTGYTDGSLTNDTTYYYGVFAVNEDGVASEGAFISATPVVGNPLSELTEGTLIKILENGRPVEFYLAKHNYEPDLNGQGRTLIVRKDVTEQMNFNTSRGNDLLSSTLLSYMQTTYKNTLSQHVQNLIGTTKVRYHYIRMQEGIYPIAEDRTAELSIFPLSATELGFNIHSMGPLGEKLPIADQLGRVYSPPDDYGEVSDVDQWTRSVPKNDHWAAYVGYVWANNGVRCDSDAVNSYAAYARPTFTLPADTLIDTELNLVDS